MLFSLKNTCEHVTINPHQLSKSCEGLTTRKETFWDFSSFLYLWSKWANECKTVSVAQWLSTRFSGRRCRFDIIAGPLLEVLKIIEETVLPLSLHLGMVFPPFKWFFQDYKPEVLSHSSFKSQLCGSLKKAQSSRCCGLSFVLHPSRKHQGVQNVMMEWGSRWSVWKSRSLQRSWIRFLVFLLRRALVILKVWYVCEIISISCDVQSQNKL